MTCDICHEPRPCSKGHYRNTSVICNWCGARVKWLKLGDHMQAQHESQRIFRPHSKVKADARVVRAEWREQDATPEELAE
jgi:hypothetical protein